MPPLSQLPDGVTRDRFMQALESLGFRISKRGGKGSHYKATWPGSVKSITLQYDFRKDVLYHVVKEIEKISDITWDDIKEHL